MSCFRVKCKVIKMSNEIRCLLCSGSVAYQDEDTFMFFEHLRLDHEVRCGQDWVLGGSLMDWNKREQVMHDIINITNDTSREELLSITDCEELRALEYHRKQRHIDKPSVILNVSGEEEDVSVTSSMVPDPSFSSEDSDASESEQTLSEETGDLISSAVSSQDYEAEDERSRTSLNNDVSELVNNEEDSTNSNYESADETLQETIDLNQTKAPVPLKASTPDRARKDNS